MNDNYILSASLKLHKPVDKEVITDERIRQYFVETFAGWMDPKVKFEIFADAYKEVEYRSSIVIMTQDEYKKRIALAERKGMEDYATLMTKIYTP